VTESSIASADACSSRPIASGLPEPRFLVFGMGMAKTGSTSIAALFGEFRAGHEFMMRESCTSLVAWLKGSISSTELRRFLRHRATVGLLEVDSATFHWAYATELVREFPDAKYIVTYRHWYSWLDSVLDMLMTSSRELPDWFYDYGRLVTGVPLSRSDFSSRRRAVDAVQANLEQLLEHWNYVNRRLLQSLPSDRRLLLNTCSIGDRIPEIARLAGVEPHRMRSASAHSNRTTVRHRLLTQVNQASLRDQGRRRCEALLHELHALEERQFATPKRRD
jgi:hypothetical protein